MDISTHSYSRPSTFLLFAVKIQLIDMETSSAIGSDNLKFNSNCPLNSSSVSRESYVINCRSLKMHWSIFLYYQWVKWSYIMWQGSRSTKPTYNYQPGPQSILASKIVLILQSATLLFCFILNTLNNCVSSCSSRQPMDSSNAPNSRQTELVSSRWAFYRWRENYFH